MKELSAQDASVNTKRKIIVLGAHPKHGYSMRQYSETLRQAYSEKSVEVELLTPKQSRLWRLLPSKLSKLALYFDKLLLFPISVHSKFKRESAGNNPIIHIADHSDAPWTYIPALKQSTIIITCHDLIAIKASKDSIPEHTPKIWGRLYQQLILSGIQRATLICAVSKTTALDCRDHIPCVPRVYLPNPLRKMCSKELPGSRDSKIAEPPFALIVSSAGWRKRRELGIRIWNELSKSISPETQLNLIIVGPELQPEEARNLLDVDLSKIEFRTNVDDEVLSQMYERAEFLIQCSKYEGFGLPIIEANSRGTPALCANEPIFREVAQYNVFFDDKLELLDPHSIMQELRLKKNSVPIRGNAERYSWQEFLSHLDVVLKKTM